ncbi:MSHA biogenesis protein MshJ [Noviherbaspirillum humi]|uniref:MSHA biogenesis protein MshJ n=1 Tax=Noviherbaspirillum humi TaxID=1688639 RepID=A0A239HMY3_9BURK|nr:type II secretion system protein M [Noviherbaspirillum humi]SNS82515.1 MSHA biogenesis protein MshJ [Noviherbaspirillum humi]
MKSVWERYANWVDYRSLPERGAIFAGLLMLLAALFYLLMFEPADIGQRAAESQMQANLTTIRKLEKEIARSAGESGVDPNVASRARLAQLSARTRDVEQAIEANKKDLVAPEQMVAMLEAVISRQQDVKLVSLVKLPVRGLDSFNAAPAVPATANPAPMNLAGAAAALGGQPPAPQPGALPPVAPEELVFMHGMQITVEGSYQNLVNYVRQLEALPVRMVWGNMILTAKAYPTSVLTLEVYTLSLEKKWLNL